MMPNTNQTTCPYCGTILNADDPFCGNCGRPFASRTSYPTRHDEEQQQGLRTRVLSDPEHPTYTPDPTQPGYPSPPLLQPRNSLQGKTRVWQLVSLISVLLVVILLLVIVFQAVRATNSQNPNTQPTNVVQTGVSNASTPSVQPTATATQLPTPTPLPKPGTVLCQPKASDWPQNGAWQTVGTEYVYKENGSSPPVVAPCDLSVSDYAVEAKIRTSELTTSLMWVVARFDSGSGAGYKGGIGVGVLCNDCIHAELYDMLNSQRNTAEFGAFSVNTVYTIKLQVKGTDVALYVNNSLVLEQHYTSANDAGKVGVECDQACEILQFTVVAQ